MFSLNDLPNELLDHVCSFVSAARDDDHGDAGDDDGRFPSVQNLRDLPDHNITASKSFPLKNLSRVSSRWLAATRPRLFCHARYELRDQDRFLAFCRQHCLTRHVRTVVVSVRSIFRGSERDLWWSDLFAVLDPDSVTVVAPPYMFADMARCRFEDTHAWAFHMPLQTMHFRQLKSRALADDGKDTTAENEGTNSDNFFTARPWTEILFNEGSFLRAYSTYEYYLLRAPSVMVDWGSVEPLQSPVRELPYPASAITRLTSFCYTAIFPFYTHTNLVLKVVRNMTSLRHLEMQLAPNPGSSVFEEEQQTGSLNPNDPWMELDTSYQLLAHSVRYLGVQGKLTEFLTHDYRLDALREILSQELARRLGAKWDHDGNGLWRRRGTGDT